MELEHYLPFGFQSLALQSTINQIVQLNETTWEYGLTLSQKDANALVETRNKSLKANGRIEIGSETIEKIIEAFCNSQYINQREYVYILHDLLETFYYIKNETLDLISDDKLIFLMKDYYENQCFGSIELLKHRELETLARNLRFNIADYENMEEFKYKYETDEEEEY